jgi:protein gp37
MKVFPQGELRLDEKEFKTDLGKGNFIFVGSSCDMFAEGVPDDWIYKVLAYCKLYPANTYLFQTKNPKRFEDFFNYPDNSVFGTTIETNRENNLNKAPRRDLRMAWMCGSFLLCKRKMVTIEPVMDFDVSILAHWIEKIRPEWVNVGADSKNHKLPEPSKFKIDNLIGALEKFTKVKRKDNLGRIVQ